MEKPEYIDLLKLIKDLLNHLDYCGWGDHWERERSEDLRKNADEIFISAGGKITKYEYIVDRYLLENKKDGSK